MVKEILQKAREFLSDERNWVKLSAFEPRLWWTKAPDATCAMLAIRRAASQSDIEDRISAYTALMRAAGLPRRKTQVPLIEWNDAPERTHKEVLAAFDKAIAEAK